MGDPGITSVKIRFITVSSLIAKFMEPTWGPPGSCRPQMGPILAPWTLLSGYYMVCLLSGHSLFSALHKSLEVYYFIMEEYWIVVIMRHDCTCKHEDFTQCHGIHTIEPDKHKPPFHRSRGACHSHRLSRTRGPKILPTLDVWWPAQVSDIGLKTSGPNRDKEVGKALHWNIWFSLKYQIY